jgi:DNA-binding MarR family transcriptional regulator
VTEPTREACERLIVLLAQYSGTVSRAMAKVTPAPDLVGPGPITVLSVLDLEGPSRPGHLQRVTGLSSGGVSKMLDRLSEAKLIRRAYGVVPGDNRGVLVSITPQGRRLVRSTAAELGKHLPETTVLLKEVLALSSA